MLPAGVGFGKSDVTLADSVSVATLLFHTILISNDTLAPFAIEPAKQVMVVVVAKHPAEPETKLAPAGSAIVVTTLVAVCGPALVIFSVNPVGEPSVAAEGPDRFRDKFAAATVFRLQLSTALPATPLAPSTAISYSVPERASNSKLLVPPVVVFAAMGTRVLTIVPVYTANNVLNPLPFVSRLTCPFDGAVHFHQIELPPLLPAWLGSPVSLLARRLVPLVLPEVPVIEKRLMNRSFAGLAAASRSRRGLVIPLRESVIMTPLLVMRV